MLISEVHTGALNQLCFESCLISILVRAAGQLMFLTRPCDIYTGLQVGLIFACTANTLNQYLEGQ